VGKTHGKQYTWKLNPERVEYNIDFYLINSTLPGLQ